MGKLIAEAQIVVPMIKIIITPKKSCLVVNHWTSGADIGITQPITSMKPVAIHWTVGKVTLNSSIKVIKAILSKVSFKMAKKAPMIKLTIIGKVFTFGSSAKN